ncbi:MAG: acyltransferase family protein [Gammaproteobacteria bacterium]
MNAARDSRLLTIDVARGVGILLVVLGHNAVFRETSHSLYEAIYLFHMPLFFFLSGVTFSLTSPGDTLRKRARALLVPYFTMGAVAVLLTAQSGDMGNVLGELRGVLYGTGHTIRFVPLWFLPCLFVVSVSTAAVIGVTRAWLSIEQFERWRPRLLAVIAVLALIGGVLVLASGTFARAPFVDASGRPIGLPWSLDLLPFVLALFVAGILFRRSRIIRDCPMPAAVVVAACVVLAFLVANGVSLDLNYRRMTHAFAVVGGIGAGVGLVFALATLIARVPTIARLFAYLGSASLILLMLHSPLQRRVLELFVARDVGSWVSVVLSVSITVAFISAFDIWILRRVRALGWVVYPRREAAKAA